MQLSGIKDALAHCMIFAAHHFFIITWLTFFVAAIFSSPIQRALYSRTLSLSAFVNYCFPFAAWKSRSARTDIFLYVFSKFLNRFYSAVSGAVGVPLAAFVAFLLNAYAPVSSPWKIDLTMTILLALVFFVVQDFAGYVSHYLQHFVPVLWELHKVHHSATFLSPLTTLRTHPLGIVFDNFVAVIVQAVPIGLVMHLYHMNMLEAFLLSDTAFSISAIVVLDSLRHSQFPVSFGIFDRILLSPHAHQLHHSCKVEHWDKNFGNRLSIWDWCFGTMAPPKKGEQFPYGLGKAEDQDYHTVYGAYLGPVVKIARLWRGEPSWHDPSKPLPPRTPFFDRLFWRRPPRVIYETLRGSRREPASTMPGP